MIRVLAALTTLSLAASSNHERLLYRTGFEGAAYAAGLPLGGQDDWQTFVAPDAAVVVAGPHVARNGRRAVQCQGGGPLAEFNGLLDGLWFQQVELGATCEPPRVRVDCAVRLDGPDTGDGPQDDLVSANLYAIDGPFNVFFLVSSNGSAWAFSSSAEFGNLDYRFETPIELGEYTDLAITLDYATFMATFEVDGDEIGTLPFGDGETQQFFGAALEFAALDDPQVVDPSLYTGSWDNVAVTMLRRER